MNRLRQNLIHVGKFVSRNKFGLVVGVMVLLGLAWWQPWVPRTGYDAQFARLRVGMKRSDVEIILGPPTGYPTGAAASVASQIVGFRGVDAPPLDQMPSPIPDRFWWFNGSDRLIYVEYSGDILWRTKLFGPNRLERVKGG